MSIRHPGHRRLIRFGTGALLLAWLSTGGAATLQDAWRAALGNSPVLAAARADLTAAQAQAAEAQAGYWPQISLQGHAGRTNLDNIETDTAFALPASIELDNRAIALEVIQPLYTGGRISAQDASAEARLGAQQARFAASRQEVLLTAARAYLGVYEARAVLKLAENNTAVIIQQRATVAAAHERGAATATSVAQAEARLAAAQAALINARGQLTAAEASYRRYIGASLPAELSLPEQIDGLPTDLTSITAATRQNFTVLAAQQSLTASHAQREATEAAGLPQISLTARVAHALEPDFVFARQDTRAIALTLSMPIYTGGALHARESAAAAIEERQQQLLEASERAAIETATRAFVTHNSAMAQENAIASQITAATRALEGVRAEYQYGERTLLDVLDAEQELLNARVSAVHAKSASILSALQLKAALGQLTFDATAGNIQG